MTVFSKNRDRLLKAGTGAALFPILAQVRHKPPVSDEHFTVDGTLIEAWAGQKSFKKKGGGDSPPTDGGGNPTVDFRGEKRSNETHQSTTDPDARLFKKAKGQESKLCYLGHVVMENRNGLVVDTELTQASGRAEREAALSMVKELPGIERLTLGGDKAYDAKVFVEDLRDQNVTPHVAQNTTNRPSAIDGRTTRHYGYEMSQKARKRIEEVFGWMKTIGPMAKTKYPRSRSGRMDVYLHRGSVQPDPDSQPHCRSHVENDRMAAQHPAKTRQSATAAGPGDFLFSQVAAMSSWEGSFPFATLNFSTTC